MLSTYHRNNEVLQAMKMVTHYLLALIAFLLSEEYLSIVVIQLAVHVLCLFPTSFVKGTLLFHCHVAAADKVGVVFVVGVVVVVVVVVVVALAAPAAVVAVASVASAVLNVVRHFRL